MIEALRSRHDSRGTKEAYLHWIRRFLVFHSGTHPHEMAERDVNRFLTHLAIGANVAASTAGPGSGGGAAPYEHVLERPLDRLKGVVRARKPKRLPVVLTGGEVEAVLAQLGARRAWANRRGHERES